MMTAVDWWKTFTGVALPVFSLTIMKCNFLRVIGKAHNVGGLHNFLAQPIMVYPHLSLV
jgi:hypothetical protein